VSVVGFGINDVADVVLVAAFIVPVAGAMAFVALTRGGRRRIARAEFTEPVDLEMLKLRTHVAERPREEPVAPPAPVSRTRQILDEYRRYGAHAAAGSSQRR
jgi:hypothetical protein